MNIERYVSFEREKERDGSRARVRSEKYIVSCKRGEKESQTDETEAIEVETNQMSTIDRVYCTNYSQIFI